MKSLLQKLNCRKPKDTNDELVHNFFGDLATPDSHQAPRDSIQESLISNVSSRYSDPYDDEDDTYDYLYDLKDKSRTDTNSNGSLSERKSTSGRTSMSGRTSRSGRSGESASGKYSRSVRSGDAFSGRDSRSGRSLMSASGRSGRSGVSDSGRSRRSVYSVNMAGSLGSTGSSRQTERIRNRRQPRSPPPPQMNIYIQKEPRSSFTVPVTSESFAQSLLSDNILDSPPPTAKTPLTAKTKTAEKESDKDLMDTATPIEKSKSPMKPPPDNHTPQSAALIQANKKEPPSEKRITNGTPRHKNHKTHQELLDKGSPTKRHSNRTFTKSTEIKDIQTSDIQKSGTSSKRQNGSGKPDSAEKNNGIPTSIPPPPPFSSPPPISVTPPFSSVVREVEDNDKYNDLLISPLTAPTMAVKIQIPRVLKDDDFSVAPSLEVQKRSIVTVSKKVDTNGSTSNSNSNGNSGRSEKSSGNSDENRITTNLGFDDIYERGKQLGFGAFANVFLATHKPTGCKYAVKEVDRSSMVWNDRDHLQQEIDNMFKVREGPNIVQLYEVYSNKEEDDNDDDEQESPASISDKDKRRKKRKKKNLCHLVVELMEGGELFDRIIEKRTFTEREARDSIRCVLEALKYMHDRRVVHRDLKPENLLLKSNDKTKLTPVKLADFGFAKSIKSKNGCRSLCGTPGYLAPEILERFPSYDVQCDIWSVGAILFLLLGGYLPFDDDNEEKVFDRTRNAAYDFGPRCWRNISFGAKDLISRCLTIDPRKRFTARDCLNHSWMANNDVARDVQLKTNELEATRKAKRKMRAAVKTLMAVNRLDQLNNDFTNYLEKKRKDSMASVVSYMTTGTRYGHARFEEDGPSGKPFKHFYQIGELMGEDEYCSVHRCHHKSNNMPYDVKHVHLTNLDSNARKTVRDEITALKLLRGGPHVIRLLDVFEESNNPEHIYLVFEAMKGGNLLSRIVEKEVYTEREARQVCKTVFTAINYCHKKKVAHRDIKPQNVFLHEEGDDTTVRVANFGFAKRVTHENSLKTLCGTANYVAPEILDNQCPGYDQRCDIWSLGVFTYVLLGGYPPFEGVHENLAVEIMRGQYVFDEEYWSEISDPAKRMISSMLQVDPNKRTTLTKALACKWMEMEEERLVLRDLSTAQNSIRETLKPVAKVKAAVNAILARNKFLSIAGMFKHNDTTSIYYNSPVRNQTIDEVEEKSFRDTYLWGSQIGIGSFSVVHEVMKKDTKEIFAAKRIDRKNLHPSDAIALHDEIAALEQVSDCDQIVKLHNYFDEPDYTFLVLECMKGGDLIDRIIERHNYTEYDAKEVCRQLLLGVAYCHEKKIANRNLKPENLLLKANSDTDVKISDFGYAKTVTFPNSLRTQCGTEGYVAPEILEHRPSYDVSCDMWSLGVILYIVLGGYRPFRGEGDDVMRQIRYGEYKFHKRYWDHVSEDAKNLITRMLTVDPTKRITAETALRNRWIQADEDSLGGTELSSNMKELKDLRSAKRKVKAATKAIIATNKLQSISGFRAYQDF